MTHPVDREVQDLPRLHDLVQPIDVTEYLLEHLRLVQYRDLVLVVPVRARVDDPVHVQIEVVDGGDGRPGPEPAVQYVGILVGEPAEHLGYAEEGGGGGGRAAGGPDAAARRRRRRRR